MDKEFKFDSVEDASVTEEVADVVLQTEEDAEIKESSTEWGNMKDRAIRLEILMNPTIPYDEYIKGYTKEEWLKSGNLGLSPDQANEKFLDFFGKNK